MLYCSTSCLSGTTPATTSLIFERTIVDGRRVSSDYAFCDKWRKHGAIYIDPELRSLSHVGQKTWTGCYGAYLRRANGLAIPQALQAIHEGAAQLRHFEELVQEWGNPQWSVDHVFAAVLVDLAREATGPILECGSGLSTLILAAATDQPIHVLEHDALWAQ